MTQEEINVRLDALEKKIEGFHQSEEIECLNLIMKKQYALDIISGKKKVEYRNYSKHYFDRLYDKEVLDFYDKYANDEEVIEICKPLGVDSFIDPVRLVRTIRFHNYNDTWSLTVEVVDNHIIALTDPNINYMYEEFGDTEFAESVKELQKAGIDDRPVVFFFALGKILERKNI